MPLAPSAEPVVVVGGSLAGMAAAARLAKLGHRVVLIEARDRLGGSWAAHNWHGITVDRVPAVLPFPAPWRDLFRKSGRPLEAELSRAGLELITAPAPRHEFVDGTSLIFPTERGEQFAALSQAFGVAVAARWRDFVDDLDLLWQTVRPLGHESELRRPEQLTPPIKKVLRSATTIEQLARSIDEPHLAAIIRLVAHRLGSTPAKTPAWCAVQLAVERTFGCWTISGAEAGRSSVLIELLAKRLELRKVDLRLGQRVTQINFDQSGTFQVAADSKPISAAAVICATDPWQSQGLIDSTAVKQNPAFKKANKLTRKLSPAVAPAVDFALSDAPTAEVTETVVHAANGWPTVIYARPVGDQTLQTIHNFAAGGPDPSAGASWNRFRSWLWRPAVSTAVPGLYFASRSSAAGSGPSQTVLSGALASYGCQEYLAPDRPDPER